MAETIEIALFLFSLAGFASLGYWALIFFWPAVREKEQTLKLGYGFLAGAGIFMALALTSFFWGATVFGKPRFLDAFFWLSPLPFLALGGISGAQRAWILLKQRQMQIQGEPVPAMQPAAPKKESRESKATEQKKTEVKPQTAGNANDSFPPLISGENVFSQDESEKEPEKKEEKQEIQSSENMLEAENKNELDWKQLDETAEEETPKTEPGEQERDVEEEIRKIMKGETPSDEKAPPETAKKKKSALEPADIEKIKRELRKKMAEE